MKNALLLSAAAMLAFSLNAADPNPKEIITGAAKALGEKANYSWVMTTVVPEGSPFKPGPWEGQVEKGGCTVVSFSFGENKSQFVVKGDKAAMNGQDGWQSLSEMENSEGPGRFFSMIIRNFKVPAAQAVQIAELTKELKKEGDVFASDLTEDGVKTLLSWRAPAGGEGPKITGAKGSAKFWIKEGALIKYEFKLKGTMTFNDNNFDQDRTTLVEIKDVEKTKVVVPEEAKKKLQ